MNWARRLKRVFAIDIEKGDDCGGRVKIIAAMFAHEDRNFISGSHPGGNRYGAGEAECD